MLRVKQSFFAGSVFFPQGKLVDNADEVVKGRADLFEAVDSERAGPVVETATAAPGEKRAVKRVAKKKAE